LKNKTNITLIPLAPLHYDLVSKWNFDESTSEFFSERPAFNETQQQNWFKAQLKNASKRKLIIQENNQNNLIGIISLMKIDFANQHAEIGITIGERDYLGKGFAKKAMVQTLKIAFEELLLNTVYLTVFENNKNAINLFTSLGFEQEGILKNRVFKNGKFISLISMSIQAIK
jgi:UDP-4-amino-4,6-dideoxy-N-acetyl-beta-L-altrosamine N-acetyltransferase